MRCLPDRTQIHRPLLRSFQIAQAAALTLIVLMTAIFGEILVGEISFWSVFTVIAWIIFWGRCGWTATMMVPPTVFSILTPVCDAPWIDVSTIQAAVVGLGIGGGLDLCGLATTRIASPESKDLEASPETMAAK